VPEFHVEAPGQILSSADFDDLPAVVIDGDRHEVLGRKQSIAVRDNRPMAARADSQGGAAKRGQSCEWKERVATIRAVSNKILLSPQHIAVN
jgi:hypothetical protein